MSRQPTTQDKALMAGLFWQGWLINGRPATWDDMTPNERARSEVEWRRYLVKYSEDQPRVPAGDPAGGEFAGGSGGTSNSEAKPGKVSSEQAGGYVSPGMFDRGSGAPSQFDSQNTKLNEALGKVAEWDIEKNEQEQARLSGVLADKLQSNPVWHKAYGNDAEKIKAGVTTILSNWAMTSGDSDAFGVALQLAAKDEFKLTSAATKHMTDGFKGKENTIWENAANGLGVPVGQVKDVLRAYTRAEYENTQQWLADRGIKEVAVYRGMARSLGRQRYAVGTTTLQPISSFSASHYQASGFVAESDAPEYKRNVLLTMVPAKSVLSTCRSGRGVWTEKEVLTLGRKMSFVGHHVDADWPAPAGKIKWPVGKSWATKTVGAADDDYKIDDELGNADWTKQSWGLPPYKSDAFNKLVPDLNKFRSLPVYKHAVKKGLIKDDEWVAKKATKSVGLLTKYSEDQPRVPAGSPEGGEFGSSGSAGTSEKPKPSSSSARRDPLGGKVSREDFEPKPGQYQTRFEELNEKLDQAIGSIGSTSMEKDVIVSKLSKELLNDPRWTKAFGTNQLVSYQKANMIVHQWAITSGDHSSVSVAMQLATRDEFGLGSVTGHMLDGFGGKEKNVWERALNQITEGRVTVSNLKGALRAFSRAEYNNTQKWLASKGIAEVAVYRGMARALGRQTYATGSTTLQPMSSFSSSKSTAEQFIKHSDEPSYKRNVLASIIPAKSVLSTCRSGRGCWGEQEVVALGHRMEFVGFKAGSKFPPPAHKIKWPAGKGWSTKAVGLPDDFKIDEDLDSADWPKTTWDLPPYKSAAFNAIGFDLTNFRKLPVYVNAVKTGLIKEDEWVGLKAADKAKGVVRLAKYSEDQPRAPAGDPEGGEWTSGGGGGGVSGSGGRVDGLPSDVKLGPEFVQYHEAVERGAFDFSAKPSSYAKDTYDVTVTPKGIPSDWKQDARGRSYDPTYAEEKTEDGYTRLALKDNASADYPQGKEPGYIFRGMSNDEYETSLKQGYIESRGAYNLGADQKGLTYYSTNKEQAAHYASGYAPWQWKPTPGKPAVIVRVKDPGNHVRVAGTGETEVGIRGRVPMTQVDQVHFGRPTIVEPGEFQVRVSRWRGQVTVEEGSSTGYSSTVRWERRDGTPRAKYAAYLTKYSEDQPRDDHGRWTSEGGGESTSGTGAQGLPHGGNVPGSESGVGSSVRPDSTVTAKYGPLGTKPLEGLPTQVTIPGKGKVEAGPYLPAREVAANYMREAGLPYNPPSVYVKVDTERASRIASAYDQMKNDPHDPEVKAAYAAMIKESVEQFHAIEKTGLDISFIDYAKHGDPYAASPRLATQDVHDNNHLWVFPTAAGFGSDVHFDATENPLLAKTSITVKGHQLLANDVFRIVHDYFGHIKEGVGFRADGEENAWRSHAAMFSPLALRAMTSETRGQNSWVNYGPHGEHNRTASASDTIFADQKVGLLPRWVSTEGSKALNGAVLLKSATLTKYSEDEPRDDHGRWTSGGGSSGGESNPEGAVTGGGSGSSGPPPALTPAQREIETRFAAQLQVMSPQELENSYSKLKDSEGGKVLSVDVVRELSKDYLADRTLASAVHEPAKKVINELYAKKLAEAPKEGEKPLVLFTAGGTGAGKTTAISSSPELSGIKATAQIIYDSNVSSFSSGAGKIDQALAAGKSVAVGYIYRDPVEALTGGALKRAMGQEAEFGSGRTLPLAEHANTHIGSRDAVQRLSEHYANNPRVSFIAMDNSHGPTGARPMSMTSLPKMPGLGELTGKLEHAINNEYAHGRISQTVYRGFTGHAPPG